MGDDIKTNREMITGNVNNFITLIEKWSIVETGGNVPEYLQIRVIQQ